MARTNVKGTQVLDGSITRPDLNTTTAGSSVITKAIAGDGISLSSSGADAGTGDVTINANLSYLDGRYPSLITSRAQNSVFAGPSSGSGVATFRNLVAGDIPALAISGITGLQTALDAKISGAGTAGYLAKYTSALTQGMSIIFESSGNLNIGGATAPTARLSFEDNIVNSAQIRMAINLREGQIAGTLPAYGFAFGNSAANNYLIYRASTGSTANDGHSFYVNNTQIATFRGTGALHINTVNGQGAQLIFGNNISTAGSETTVVDYRNGSVTTSGVPAYSVGLSNPSAAGILIYRAGSGTGSAFGHRFTINDATILTINGTGEARLLRVTGQTATPLSFQNFASASDYVTMVDFRIGQPSTTDGLPAFSIGQTATGTENYLVFRAGFGNGTTHGHKFLVHGNEVVRFRGDLATILSGALGIGTSTLTGYALRIQKTITGAVTSYGISNSGEIQSGVTTAAYMNHTSLSTQAASFTLASAYHYAAIQGTIGAGSTVTNQIGFLVGSSLTGASNNYGFYGDIPAGANRWNIYMAGTANNYMAGSLGIGTTALSTSNLRVSKSLTGNANFTAIQADGTVQSDVTSTVSYFRTTSSTAAASFTMPWMVLYDAAQGTLGAGSTVTNQIGFYVGATLVGGANNHGFRGDIPSGTGRFNVYMSGTANNYFSGNVWIGTNTGTYKLDVTGDINTTTFYRIGGIRVGEWGSFQTSTQYSSFASVANWGATFVNGSATGMPGSSTQWHVMKLGIGTDVSTHATYLAFGRPYSTYFDGKLYVRGIYGVDDSGWIEVGKYTGTGAISVNGTTNVISIATANASTTGALSSTDWNTFNNKITMPAGGTDGQVLTKFLGAITWGTLPVYSGSSPISVSGTVISIATASSSQTGALSASNWTTFNNKLSDGFTADLAVTHRNLIRFKDVYTSGTLVYNAGITYNSVVDGVDTERATIHLDQWPASPSDMYSLSITGHESTHIYIQSYLGNIKIATEGKLILQEKEINFSGFAAGKVLVATSTTKAEWQSFSSALTASAPLSISGGTISIATANEGTTGALTGADWAMFSNKLSMPGGGSDGQVLVKSGSSLGWGSIPIYSGSGAISVSGTAISIATANESTTGALTGADWSMFYNRFSLPGGGSDGQVLMKSRGSVVWGTVSGGGGGLSDGFTSYVAPTFTNGLYTGGITFTNSSNVNAGISYQPPGVDKLWITTSGNTGIWISTYNGPINIQAGTYITIQGIEIDFSGFAYGKILKATSSTKAEWVNP